jgi:anthranilate synthase component II
MILLIDNYDSFTYNLLHYISEIGAKVEVVRNDAITVEEALAYKDLQGIVLSPGPCTPDESGICMDIIKQASGKIPLLGVCLGHEAIGQMFGGDVIRAPEPVHGKVCEVYHEGQGIFKDIPSPFKATRYHSLILDAKTLPECLDVTAKTKDGIIMAIQHKTHKTYGVQFHPESIASEYGHDILRNFLEVTK